MLVHKNRDATNHEIKRQNEVLEGSQKIYLSAVIENIVKTEKNVS